MATKVEKRGPLIRINDDEEYYVDGWALNVHVNSVLWYFKYVNGRLLVPAYGK
jgi:hypothetical protein